MFLSKELKNTKESIQIIIFSYVIMALASDVRKEKSYRNVRSIQN